MSVSLDVLSLKSLSNGLANTKNMGRSGKKTCSSLGEYFYFSSWYVGINFSWDCSHLIKLIFLLKWNLGCLLIKGSSFCFFFWCFFFSCFVFLKTLRGKKRQGECVELIKRFILCYTTVYILVCIPQTSCMQLGSPIPSERAVSCRNHPLNSAVSRICELWDWPEVMWKRMSDNSIISTQIRDHRIEVLAAHSWNA